MHLAFRGHIDDDIVQQQGMAAEATAVGQWRFALAILDFSGANRRQMTARGVDLMFRKRAFGTDNLAATTEAATTADRVNIHPQYSRCMEQRRIHRKAAAATRGGKNHFHLLIHRLSLLSGILGSFSATATNPPFPFGNRFAIGFNPVGTVGIIAHHYVATAHRRHHFCMQWTGDGGGHSGAHSHG